MIITKPYVGILWNTVSMFDQGHFLQTRTVSLGHMHKQRNLAGYNAHLNKKQSLVSADSFMINHKQEVSQSELWMCNPYDSLFYLREQYTFLVTEQNVVPILGCYLKTHLLPLFRIRIILCLWPALGWKYFQDDLTCHWPPTSAKEGSEAWVYVTLLRHL